MLNDILFNIPIDHFLAGGDNQHRPSQLDCVLLFDEEYPIP